MDNQNLEKYAQLIVKTGLNIQPGQSLVINSPLECAPFTRMVAEAAYQAGARDVAVQWSDELLAKIRFLQAPEEVFEEFPDWQKEFYLSYVRKGAAFLSISASDPELMQDVRPERMAKAQKANRAALKEYRENLMSNKNAWSVISIPTGAWAQKIFPDLPKEQAIAKLWETIFKTIRVDSDDPIAAWNKHKANLQKRLDFLNSHSFKTLHYRNSLGTDLEVELPENHLWLGGSEKTSAGVEFIANMPTEEVFTLPLQSGVNGRVVSSKPLIYQGNLIDQFSFDFKDGRVVDFSAQKGYETLKNLLATDDGSPFLGEVALVPYNSPISDLNLLFYNTLFDENASCHFALGKAYPVCLKNSEAMSPEELKQAGVNDSLIHEDFMIGTGDLEITGRTPDGKEIPVFKNGDFVIDQN